VKCLEGIGKSITFALAFAQKAAGKKKEFFEKIYIKQRQ
jgi:hypothetical protein